MTGLYKGVSASLLREATYSTVRMGLYEPFKDALRSHEEKDLSLGKKIIAGALSGALASSFATPTDLIKVRLQADSKSNLRLRDAFFSILKKQGIAGLYRGIVPTTQRAMILTASQLPSYDHTKNALIKSGKFKEGILTHSIASMVAGIVCATTTAPIDLVKSRYMNQSFDANGKGVSYSSTFNCFKKTIQTEGMMSLFKGWVPQWLRIGPHTIGKVLKPQL